MRTFGFLNLTVQSVIVQEHDTHKNVFTSPVRFVSWSGTTRDGNISEYRWKQKSQAQRGERGNTHGHVRKEGNMKEEVKLQVSQTQEGTLPFLPHCRFKRRPYCSVQASPHLHLWLTLDLITGFMSSVLAPIWLAHCCGERTHMCFVALVAGQLIGPNFPQASMASKKKGFAQLL